MANHVFTPKLDDATKCMICNRLESSHGQCECCPNYDFVVRFKTMIMCQDCYRKEIDLTNQSNANAQGRVDTLNATIEASRAIDASVTIQSDLFNAATVAIVSLKAAIEADDTITNKPYALAEELKNRFNHYKQVVFEHTQAIVEAGNQQKAIQIYLNQMANQLRSDEREKLKIADINYKPNVVKTPKVTAISVKSTANVKGKENKADLARFAKELGVNEFTLKMVAVSKGLSIEKAADMLRRSLNEAKSEVK